MYITILIYLFLTPSRTMTPFTGLLLLYTAGAEAYFRSWWKVEPTVRRPGGSDKRTRDIPLHELTAYPVCHQGRILHWNLNYDGNEPKILTKTDKIICFNYKAVLA